jgi:hypothetical protein
MTVALQSDATIDEGQTLSLFSAGCALVDGRSFAQPVVGVRVSDVAAGS